VAHFKPSQQGAEYDAANIEQEFWRISAALDELRGVVVNALPWKGIYVEADGVTGTDPIVGGSYNLDTLTRTGVGLYRVQLRVATIAGISVADNIYPNIHIEIDPPNQPADTELFLGEIQARNEVAGWFDIQIWGAEVPPSGKLTLVAYDLQGNDRMFFFGNLSIASQSFRGFTTLWEEVT